MPCALTAGVRLYSLSLSLYSQPLFGSVGWTIVTIFSTNVTIYNHLISQAGWHSCDLSIYLSIYLSWPGFSENHCFLDLVFLHVSSDSQACPPLCRCTLFHLLGSARRCPGSTWISLVWLDGCNTWTATVTGEANRRRSRRLLASSLVA